MEASESHPVCRATLDQTLQIKGFLEAPNMHIHLKIVDGGRNPRIDGGVGKTGTELAVESTVATGLPGSPLSMPSAAEGGGQRPAFTGVSAATIAHTKCVASGTFGRRITVVAFSSPKHRHFYADLHPRQHQNTSVHRTVMSGTRSCNDGNRVSRRGDLFDVVK